MKYIQPLHEADKRIPRKDCQKAKSDKHSDLYTDEDPKGTIHGLGFKDAKKAEDSIDIIKKVDREHAHKVMWKSSGQWATHRPQTILSLSHMTEMGKY